MRNYGSTLDLARLERMGVRIDQPRRYRIDRFRPSKEDKEKNREDRKKALKDHRKRIRRELKREEKREI